MKYYIYIIICIFFSCINKEKQKRNCAYTINDFYNNVDTTMMIKRKFEKESVTEFVDKKNKINQGGIYKFDENNILRSYAFLIDTTNKALYAIEYDSFGNEISKTGSDVIQWYFRRMGGDSLAITFLLYSINYSYDSVQLQYGDLFLNNIEMYKSPNFSNLLVRTVDVALIKNKAMNKISLIGIKENSCTSKSSFFSDSTFIPEKIF